MDKSFSRTLMHRSPLTVCVASEVISMHLCISSRTAAQVHHISSRRYLSATNSPHSRLASYRPVGRLVGCPDRSTSSLRATTLSEHSDRFGRESGPRPNSRELATTYRARISVAASTENARVRARREIYE